MNDFAEPLPTVGRLRAALFDRRRRRKQNTRALAFWQRHGYAEVMREPPQLLGVKESVAIILRHPLNEVCGKYIQ